MDTRSARWRPAVAVAAAVAAVLALAAGAPAEVCNLKVVTDASPDYSDLPSLVRSVTSEWPTPAEKCWALFYWNHIARRQTAPMILHGLELADPIRQANDYGYTMCSTIAGINASLWDALGLKVRYWDITAHTVSEVEYDGRWHVYDNSMSALYTLCDGRTIAGVEDVGKEGACEASGGKTEPGHVARRHCVTATSPRGFLTGADCARDLDQEYRCFNPQFLKYRNYFYEWDRGHRYILNLKDGEVYTRHYRSLGDGPEFYVPNEGKDPEKAGGYGLRGNGVWTFTADLREGAWQKVAHSAANVAAAAPAGLRPEKAGEPARVVFKVQGANVITSQTLRASFLRKTGDDAAAISVSTNNGLAWKEVWKAGGAGDVPAEVNLIGEVNGAYEVLVRVDLLAKASPADAVLKDLRIETRTMLNAKTLPRLNLGANTVYVGAGDPTDSVVFWPELQGGRYKEHVAEEKNIACDAKHIGYQGVVYPSKPKEDAWLVYRLDVPRDLVRVTYGGRFYNRAPGSRIEIGHSLDGGKTWTTPWTLTKTDPPWDVIRYETADIPKGHRAVWVRYLMNSPVAARDACSLYAVRMEANHLPADAAFKPVEVTFQWSEVQKDRTRVQRRHTQRIEKTPFTYRISVGGEDHPVMDSLGVRLAGAGGIARDYRDAGGEKWVGRWLTCGRNLAVGRPYTLSVPSETGWGAGDPDARKLTDGICGPPYAGGTSYQWSALWGQGKNPVITLDLGAVAPCASFGMNFHGYPWWDALKGQIKDTVEVLISKDGKAFASVGFLKTDLRWKDLPVNHMWPDHEEIQGDTFRLIPAAPIEARYVQYKVTNARFFACTEVEVLDSIRFEPFDLRVALPQ